MVTLKIHGAGTIRRLEAAARFRKDILRTGTFDVDGRPWNVTKKTLDTLAANFGRAASAGNRIPVVWDHSDSARDRIGSIESVEVDGDRLFATFTAEDPDDAKRLSGAASEVSVEVREPWRDGRGNDYAMALTHLGIVNLPVVSDQGPMIRLSLVKGKKMTKRQLADGGDSEAADSSWSLDEVRDLLAKFGVNIPESATTKDAVIAVADAMSGSTETPTDTGALNASEDYSGMPPAMQASLKRRDAEIKRLTTIVCENTKRAEASFGDAVDALITRGSITPAERAKIIRLGQNSNWDRTVLEPFERIAADTAAKTSGPTRRLSTGASGDDETAAAIKERQDQLRNGVFKV